MHAPVWVELSAGKAIRIFKTGKAAAIAAVSRGVPTEIMVYADAVRQIRLAIYLRDNKTCTHCGAPVTWKTMEMHERLWRGRGGEISLDNGTCLCYTCHQDDPIAGHGKRKPQWTLH